MHPRARWTPLAATTLAGLAIAASPAAQPAGVAPTTANPAADPAPTTRLTDQPDTTARPSGQSVETPDEYNLPYAPPASIAPYVDLLNVEDFAARLNAAEFIFQTPSVTLETIHPYLTDPNVAPEARSRLEAIGDVLFRVTPRGAMGVQFERQGVAPIIIRNTVADNPFFRAHEVLEAGDEIIAADGQPVRTYDEFQGAILSHDPYETIDLTVKRAGQLLELRVPLGDYMRLGNGTIPADPVMRLAWERRLGRIREASPVPLTTTLDCRPDAPRPTNAGEIQGTGARIRASLLVAGGISRGGVDQDGDPLEAKPLALEGVSVEVHDYLRQAQLAGADMRGVEQRVEELMARHTRLVEIRQRHRDEIAQIAAEITDATLDAAVRRQLTERLSRLQVSLGETQLMIDQLNMVLPLGR